MNQNGEELVKIEIQDVFWWILSILKSQVICLQEIFLTQRIDFLKDFWGDT